MCLLEPKRGSGHSIVATATGVHPSADETARSGVLAFTCVGHHRNDGAAILVLDDEDRVRWREWRPLDDERGWEAYVEGPAG